MKGNLIIISSPSGGGKGTLIREIMGSTADIGYSVSFTTRAMRPGEENGKHYFFVTKEEFDGFIERDELLEYAEVHGNFYGTSIKTVEDLIEAGKDVILEIDVQGAELVIAKMPEAFSVFILPPNFDVLRDRLTRRNTESAADLELRLKNSVWEISRFEKFDYVVVNDEIGPATEKLRNVIMGERQRRTRQIDAVRGILNSFDVSKSNVSGE